MMRRLAIRPVVSRRLRAALLLVLLLAGLSLGQSSLTNWFLVVVIIAMLAVFIQSWRAATRLAPALLLTFRPLSAAMLGDNNAEVPIRCTRLSVYRWLIVLHIEFADEGRQVITLLPDSLPEQSSDQWRQLLIWAKLMRRQIAMKQ
jgi:hypothetical protein